MKQNLERAVCGMTDAIGDILRDAEPTIYLYGSCVLDDFCPGWSDIDILVLTKRQISEDAAGRLVTLRQEMLSVDHENPFFRAFEGGMLTLQAFLSGAKDRVVYWGTGGERIAETYRFDSFCMKELLEHGRLLSGTDVRGQLQMPDMTALRSDVRKHYETIRQFARRTDPSLYSFGWLLDISRCIYTLRTGSIIAKTAAGEWALTHGLCPDENAMQTALMVRRNPSLLNDPAMLDFAEKLGPSVQRFADVLEREL